MDIPALRALTQAEKIEGRNRPWGYRTLQRGPSIYITALLLRTRITPDLVTVIGLGLGVLGAFFLMGLSLWAKLLGLLFVYGNILSDKVDGELARARGTHSLRGVFLDELNHLIIPALIFAGTAYGLLATAGQEGLFLGAAFLIGPISLVLIRAMHNIIPAMYTKKLLKYADRFALSENTTEQSSPTSSAKSLFLLPFRILHQFQDLLIFSITIALLLIIDTVSAQSSLIVLRVYPLTSYAVVLLAALYALIVVEDAIKGVRSVEGRLRSLLTRNQSQEPLTD